jgi:D-glycero-D-manno-heptose 1,7-bisphosphate phosphatase
MTAGVILERDTLLNLATKGTQQKTPLRVEEFRIDESVLEPLQRLKAAGLLLIVTTNQPEVSRGNLPRRELDLMHMVLKAKLPIDDILICPHEESDFCPCRKPRAGMFLEAAFKWHLSLGQSYVISHRWQDSDAARVAGATSIMVKSPWLGKGHVDFFVQDFTRAADKVIDVNRTLRKAA